MVYNKSAMKPANPAAQQLRITKILTIRGFTVSVALTDGTERALRLRPHLNGPMFDELLEDPSKFRAVRVEAGTLSWPTGQDLCPDVLLNTEVAREGFELARRVAARWSQAMASICQFDGISIYLYPNDHPPPHVHAKHGDDEAEVAIANGRLIKGKLPKPIHRKVKAWLALRRNEVNAAHVLANSSRPPGKVPPP